MKKDKLLAIAVNATKTENSVTNGNIKINDTETTVYTHPANHPASMITGLPNSLPADGGNADTVGGFTVGVNVPANAEFTDTNTITTINGKTGTIVKADIVALGVPAQDTVYTHPAGTNPHGTTKSDVGLSNVTNDANAYLKWCTGKLQREACCFIRRHIYCYKFIIRQCIYSYLDR